MVTALLLFRENPFDPLSIFSYLYIPRFVVRPAFILLDLDTPFLAFLFREEPKALARETLMVFSVGYIAFILAYLSFKGWSRRWIRSDSKGKGRYQTAISMRRLRFVTSIGILVALGMIGYQVIRVGNVAEFMYASRHGLWDGLSFLRIIPNLTSLLAAFMLVESIKRRRGRALSAVFLIASLLAPTLMGDRSAVVYPIIFIIALYTLSRPNVPVVYLAIGLVMIGGLMGALDTARRSIFENNRVNYWDTVEQADGDSPSVFRTMSKALNLSVFDHFMVVKQDFDYNNFLYGDFFVRGVIGLVPRTLWEEKPKTITSGNWFSETYLPGTAGKPFTGIGEWWINFGILGVFFGMTLSGLFCRIAWEWAKHRRNSSGCMLLYLVMILSMTSGGVIASNLPSMFVLTVAPLVLLNQILRTKQRTEKASSRKILGPAPQIAGRYSV
ncbi:MAG: O-antigen polymerase [Myxococcota bacterium]